MINVRRKRLARRERTSCFIRGLSICLLAGWSHSALAFQNLGACDIVTFASREAPPVPIQQDAWGRYREQIGAALRRTPDTSEDVKQIGEALKAAQTAFLAPLEGTDVYRDYLASDSCVVLTKLAGDPVRHLANQTEA